MQNLVFLTYFFQKPIKEKSLGEDRPRLVKERLKFHSFQLSIINIDIISLVYD